MNQDTRDTITWVLGTIIAMGVVAGFAVRLILIPYLRDHLLQPVQETHKQVTENHHTSSEQPTVLDRIADVSTDVQALTRVMDTHIAWSDRWTDLIEREMELLRRTEHRHDDANPST